MNTSTDSLMSQLNEIQLSLTRYFLIPIYVFGNLGNIANIILFSKRRFRLNNVCAWYFIGASISNLFILNTGGITRIVSLLYPDFTLENISVIYCKIRHYSIQTSAIIGRYFLCLIAIDRWMITSSNESMRRMSSPKTGRNLIIFGMIILCIFNVHVAIGYDVKNGRCYANFTDIYTIFFNIYNIIIIFIPIIIMILFSILVLLNLCHSRLRVDPNLTTRSCAQNAMIRLNRQRDIQFIRLAFGQVCIFFIFIVPYGIYTMYDLLTNSIIKSVDQRAIELFMFSIVVILNYASNAITFFSYTLASKTFRKECITTIQHSYTTIRRWFTR